VKTDPVIQATFIPSGEAGASAGLSFRGVGVDVIADKEKGGGEIDIWLDGVLVNSARLAVENLPRLGGVTVFRSGRLRAGTHSIRVVRKTSAPVALDGFQVYQAA